MEALLTCKLIDSDDEDVAFGTTVATATTNKPIKQQSFTYTPDTVAPVVAASPVTIHVAQQLQQPLQRPEAPKPAAAPAAALPASSVAAPAPPPPAKLPLSQAEISMRLKSLYVPSYKASSSSDFKPTTLHEIRQKVARTFQMATPASTAAAAASSSVAAGACSSTANSERERERRHKERFIMFTRVLMKYLEQKDPSMNQRVKAIIKDCADKNKRKEPGYESVTASMRTRLKQEVGDQYWQRAEQFLEVFLKQQQHKKEQQLKASKQKQQQQQGRASKTSLSSASHRAAYAEEKRKQQQQQQQLHQLHQLHQLQRQRQQQLQQLQQLQQKERVQYQPSMQQQQFQFNAEQQLLEASLSPQASTPQVETVDRNTQEFTIVCNLFHRTCPETQYFVMEFKRITHPLRQFQQYLLKKSMDQRTDDGGIGSNAKWLFHGTKQETVTEIISNGFNRSFSNRGNFGYGIYFARDASYAAQRTYAKCDESGSQHMFLARVLLGQSTVGNSSYLTPPKLSSLSPGSGDGGGSNSRVYDSLTNNHEDPYIFVSGHNDNQASPEYLIKFLYQNVQQKNV